FVHCHLISVVCPACSSFASHARRPAAIWSLSLHDALPISDQVGRLAGARTRQAERIQGRLAVRFLEHLVQKEADREPALDAFRLDRKSTRLNSSHVSISYAVFCLKQKTETIGKCEIRDHLS